ncbi:L,D-transpeptidase [Streptomyces sp. NPDC020917]|uniref:L,D-transpeptidase n=1 Tax=Streptomyces sp. NPDC020917 TaxID=3365102 RepID=UPI0037A8411E
MSRGIPSWMAVSGLTAGAMVVVSVLAFQASGSTSANPTAAPTPHPTATKPHSAPTTPPPVPVGGDTGKRIVYSLSQNRVWVVPKSGPVSTFLVQPGTVPATPGVYYVGNRVPASTGTDGKKIEHVVFFEYTAESWVAFSAQVDDKVAAPDPNLRTGAIRMHRADALKVWNNTVRGSTVVVFK